MSPDLSPRLRRRERKYRFVIGCAILLTALTGSWLYAVQTGVADDSDRRSLVLGFALIAALLLQILSFVVLRRAMRAGWFNH
jgi:hypothetical protein